MILPGLIQRIRHAHARAYLSVVALAGAVTVPIPAAAHHAMDLQVPGTLLEGFLSGLGHPVIGLDHLAFVVAAGLVCLAGRGRRVLPLAFVGASLAGVGLHLWGVALPMAEAVIAVSVVCIGALLMAGARTSGAVRVGAFVLAGVFHGYAYGESIVGAEPAPLAAYLAGLAAVQWMVALAAQEAARRVFAGPGLERPWARAVGGIVAGIGVAGIAAALTGGLA